MTIGKRGILYYGVMEPGLAKLDLGDMRMHGCNAVTLAVSESDWFWRRSVSIIVNSTHGSRLRGCVDLWGWGKTLAGEPPSLYLMRDLVHCNDSRQEVESILAWPYKGGEGSILESDNPAAVWEAVGKAYRGED